MPLREKNLDMKHQCPTPCLHVKKKIFLCISRKIENVARNEKKSVYMNSNFFCGEREMDQGVKKKKRTHNNTVQLKTFTLTKKKVRLDLNVD